MKVLTETRRRVLLVLYTILVAVGIPAMVDGMVDFATPPDPTTADLLRYTSVQVGPGGAGVVDVGRVKRIVGDRPVAVLVAPGDRCEEVGRALPGVIVLVVYDDVDRPLTTCSHGTSGYDETALWRETQDAVSSLDREPVVYVEEFVHAFDAHVAATGMCGWTGAPPSCGSRAGGSGPTRG